MSVDLFLYTEKKIPKEHALLLACGYTDEEGFDGDYIYDANGDFVTINCETIEDADCFEGLVSKVRELVPAVKYQIHINFGGISDKAFDDIIVWTNALSKELNGVLDTDDALVCADGRKVYYESYDKNKDVAFRFSDRPFNEPNNNASAPNAIAQANTLKPKSTKFQLAISIVAALALVFTLGGAGFWIFEMVVPGFIVFGIGLLFFIAILPLSIIAKKRKDESTDKIRQENVNQTRQVALADGRLLIGEESGTEFSGDIQGMNIVDWINSDEQTAELNAHLEDFFASVQYPKSFADFMKSYDIKMLDGDTYDLPDTVKRCIAIIDCEGDTVQIGMAALQKFDTLAEFNKDHRFNDDVLPSLRDVVFFAFGESGHEDFFLDFSQNKTNPSVKLLEDQHITKLADNFDEFLAKLDYYKDDGGNESGNYNFDSNITHLTFKDAKSDKFWSCNYIDEHYLVHYGRNGTFGRIEIKELNDENATAKFVAKTAAEKMHKGYKEIVPLNDEFENHKKECVDVINSMYAMFGDEVPLINIAAVKMACEKYCDLLRVAKGDDVKVMAAVKSLILYLNQINEEHELIETDEREMLYDFINEGATLAGLDSDEDITGEWRDW